jgi:hypothetical protein
MGNKLSPEIVFPVPESIPLKGRSPETKAE